MRREGRHLPPGLDEGTGREGYSIPAQAEACRRFIADQGWELADEYVERGESARSADRPQLQAMLARLADDPTIDCLVVHKLDRLARNLEDHAAVRAALRKAHVQLHSVTESLEDSASGKLVEGILASIAEPRSVLCRLVLCRLGSSGAAAFSPCGPSAGAAQAHGRHHLAPVS